MESSLASIIAEILLMQDLETRHTLNTDSN